MLLQYISWDDWPIFMISGSNEQLQQESEYTLLKPYCHSCWISKMQSGREDTLEERYQIKFCFKLGKMPCNESWINSYDPETKRQSSQWKHAGSPRPKKVRESKSTHKLLMIPFFFDSTGMIYMHWAPIGLTVNKEYYEVLREFRKRFHQKRPALLKSGQWHFHSDNAPVCNSILVTDYLTKMGIYTVLDLALCDFWLFPKLKEKLRGCRYETIEEMKEAVTKVIDTLIDIWLFPKFRSCRYETIEKMKEAVTRGLPCDLPGVVRTVQQVHCCRRRLLRMGQEFHVCTINKSAHTKKKKSGNLLKAPRIYGWVLAV